MRSTQRLKRRRRAPDHGRRADLRFDRRHGRRRVEHRRRRPDQARAGRRADPPPARAFRAGRPAALRPGQMVSGRAAAALGLRALLARRRRAAVAERRPDRATRAAEAPADDRGRQALLPTALAGKLGPADATAPCPPTRIPAHFLLSEQQAAGQCRPRKTTSWKIPAERARLARVFDRGLEPRRSAMCCRSRSGSRRSAAAAG